MTRLAALKELLEKVDADDVRRRHEYIYEAADRETVEIRRRPRRRKKARCLKLHPMKKRA